MCYIIKSSAFLSTEVREMTLGSCAVFMCPPLVTRENVLGCPLPAFRQVVSLFVCFYRSMLVQVCSCPCSNTEQYCLNVALQAKCLRDVIFAII